MLTATVVAGGILGASIGTASSQGQACRFVLGFASLRDKVGADKVGRCLEDEHFNIDNGNAEQRTSGGLMVWRKLDNFTAFTDGATSWVAGPNGVQSRPNGERFAWEKDPVQPAAAARPAAGPPPAAQPPTAAQATPPARATASSALPAAPPTATPATPTAAPVPEPSPSAAQPTTSANLVVTDFTTYRASIGETVVVVGMVENQGTAPAGVRTIAVSLLGRSGETVGGGTAADKPTVLKPGMRAPWRASVSNAPNFKDVRVQVEAESVTRYSYDQVTHDLKVEGVTTQPRRSGSSAKVAGQVVNTGSDTVARAHILLAVLGSDGKVQDVRDAYSKLDTLPPAQSSPFEITFYDDRTNNPSRHELYVEGRIQR